MKVFDIQGFEGHYPIGTAAVVVAKHEHQAIDLLNIELEKEGLPPTTIDKVSIVQVKTHEPLAIITHNGNY